MGCGKTIFPNGTELYSSSCQNRQNFISWDGIHCSETANMLVANRILDGSISNPPLPTQRACKLTENVVGKIWINKCLRIAEWFDFAVIIIVDCWTVFFFFFFNSIIKERREYYLLFPPFQFFLSSFPLFQYIRCFR